MQLVFISSFSTDKKIRILTALFEKIISRPIFPQAKYHKCASNIDIFLFTLRFRMGCDVGKSSLDISAYFKPAAPPVRAGQSDSAHYFFFFSGSGISSRYAGNFSCVFGKLVNRSKSPDNQFCSVGGTAAVHTSGYARAERQPLRKPCCARP